MTTDTLPDTLDELRRLVALIGDHLGDIAAALDRLPAPCPMHEPGDPDCTPTHGGACTAPTGPAYHPERMGYLSEVRAGDRVLFAGGWREVDTWFEWTNGVANMARTPGVVTVTFTDPDMDPLCDKGTHAIRIQKRADEQQADALHRRDNGGL